MSTALSTRYCVGNKLLRYVSYLSARFSDFDATQRAQKNPFGIRLNNVLLSFAKFC